MKKFIKFKNYLHQSTLILFLILIQSMTAAIEYVVIGRTNNGMLFPVRTPFTDLNEAMDLFDEMNDDYDPGDPDSVRPVQVVPVDPVKDGNVVTFIEKYIKDNPSLGAPPLPKALPSYAVLPAQVIWVKDPFPFPVVIPPVVTEKGWDNLKELLKNPLIFPGPVCPIPGGVPLPAPIPFPIPIPAVIKSK